MDNELPKPIRVVAYIRKSSEDNEDGEATKQQNSLEYQRQFVKDAINKYELKLIRPNFEDDKTGYQAFVRDGENGFNAMLEYLREHRNEVDGIVCTEISRLARNFGDGGLLLWYMQDGIIKRIFTYSKVFTNSSTDQMMVAIEFAMSKKSSDDGSDRTKQGMKSKAHVMKHPARPAILGYKGDGRRGARKWLIDEVTGHLVQQVFEQFSTSKFTFDEIADYAYGIGSRSTDRKSSSGRISANTWRNRLTDKQYTGVFEHEGERIAGAYEPLITLELFYQVQQVISKHEHPKENHIEYAYSDKLIKCGLCGNWLSGTNKSGITYYRCGKKKLPCKGINPWPYLLEDELEDIFVKAFEQFELDQEGWEAARAYVVELNQPQRIDINRQIIVLNGQIAAEEKMQIDLGRKFTEGEFVKSEYDLLRKDSQQRIALLRSTIVRCENLAHELDELMDQFLDSIKHITKRLRIALPVNKREMVSIFCENIVWDGKKLRWDWKKSYYIFINQPENSTMLSVWDFIRTLNL
jgi:DNA invertase Pin-like site-specific DNA recombinase